MVEILTTVDQVNDLVRSIGSRQRKNPICVVTVSADSTASRFSAIEIEEATNNLAHVYQIESGPLTRHLQDNLPENCHVFGGAARCYSVDFNVRLQLAVSRIFYPTPESIRERETQKLVGELWGMANSAGLLQQTNPQAKAENGTVEAIFGSEVAMIKRENGDRFSLRSELAFPGVPLDKVLSVGQAVTGFFNEVEKTFALERQSYTLDNLREDYDLGAVTLGLVKSTTRQTAEVAIHPNLVFTVSKEEITGNPRDTVDDLLHAGEVYAFRIYRDPQGRTRLKSNDIDDDEEILPALALVPGGEPWLSEGLGVLGHLESPEPVFLEERTLEGLELESENEPETEFAVAEAEAAPQTQSQPIVPAANGVYKVQATLAEKASSGLDTFTVSYYTKQIKTLKLEIEKNKVRTQTQLDEFNLLVGQYNAKEKELNQANEKLTKLRADLSDAKKDLRAERANNVVDPWDSRNFFDGYGDWFSYELNRVWVETYSPEDRRQMPLKAETWTYGEHFFENFNPATFNATLLRKILRTVLELVTGRGAADGTERHPLTDGHGGAQKIRGADGARAMRMYVEEVAASARRLHYWELANGVVELAQISVHDDYTIR